MFKALVVFAAAVLVSIAVTPRAPARVRLGPGPDDLRLN